MVPIPDPKLLEFIRTPAPPADNGEPLDVLGNLFDSYPFCAFILYSEKDKDIAAFISTDGDWLHRLSGKDCLIGVFENPKKWDKGWVHDMQRHFGPDFERVMEKWKKIEPYERNNAFDLCSILGIEKNAVPCIVFAGSISSKKFLCMPIIADTCDYENYFKDIFTAVNTAAKVPARERLEKLRSEWKKLWAKWIMPEKAKALSESIQEWGSLIKDTKCALIDAVEPVTPVLSLLVSALAKVRAGT
jgi:hypothetical protein